MREGPAGWRVAWRELETNSSRNAPLLEHHRRTQHVHRDLMAVLTSHRGARAALQGDATTVCADRPAVGVVQVDLLVVELDLDEARVRGRGVEHQLAASCRTSDLLELRQQRVAVLDRVVLLV